MIQKPVPNCQWLIPKQARQVVGFLGGFTDMISQFSQEKDKYFEARLFIKQNDQDENATIQFHFGPCSDEMIEDFQTKYDIGEFFSINDVGWLSFSSSVIGRFSPEWVDDYNAETVIPSSFLEYCPAGNVKCASHHVDEKGKLACSFTFEIQG